MSARAVVTRYSGETVLLNGNFSVDAYFLVCDPAIQGTGQNDGKVLVAAGIQLDATTPSSWSAAIEAAVIAEGADKGFADLTAATVFIPTIA
jgi:hypothetical protein